MPILIVKNIASEGPGTIGDFLEEHSIPMRVVALKEVRESPPVWSFNALAVMGGPMAVYEMDRYPHLKRAADLIDKAIKREIKVLGICLGAQLIAHVLGAKVYAGKAEEKGWMDVELTQEGIEDDVIGVFGKGPAKVLQWHGDTFDLPEGAVRLAKSELYENQAFKYGKNVYALQFHIEADEQMIDEWFGGDPEIMKETRLHIDDCSRKADEFYRMFFGIDK